MVDKKWYIGSRDAEGCAIFFVELSPEEVEAVIKFASAQNFGPDEGYSGVFAIHGNSFDSLEAAEEYAHDKSQGFYFSPEEWAEYKNRKNNKPVDERRKGVYKPRGR